MEGTALIFDKDGWAHFTDYNGAEILLGKDTWDHIVAAREREYFAYNIDLIKDTLAAPDEVRQSRMNRYARLVYKKLRTLQIRPNVDFEPKGLHMTIVIEKRGKADFIQTMYTTKNKKKGKMLWSAE